MSEKIHVWQIWEVTTENFLTSWEEEGEKQNWCRQTKLKKGEKIEIRYPYAWHFRTEDNHYFHATEEMILENCVLFWVILERIRFWNIAKLSEILRLDLFDKQK